MALYDGVPSIRLEGDEKRALALIPEAKALLYTLQTFVKTAGVSTFSMSRRVGDDGYIYVLCAGGQNIINISVAPTVVDEVTPTPGSQHGGVLMPDFYSGMTFNGYLVAKTRTEANGTLTHYKVLADFVPTPTCVNTHQELVNGRQQVPRLAVAPGFAELENDAIGGPEFSQYTKLRPSMYSGTMKKVVQIVMGLGRVSLPKQRDPFHNAPDTQYMKDAATNGVQVRYDYKFHRTHGIVRAEDDRLWLVEISMARGVIAMPLPIYPASDSEFFRARALDQEDGAMVTAVDDLGGLPTGESFPVTAERLAARIASGDILQLLTPNQLEGFYKASPYSTVLGWAFNDTGSEAHNTAYYYDDAGFQKGIWWQISLSIGAMVENRLPNTPIAPGHASAKQMGEGFIYCPPPEINLTPEQFVPFKFYSPLLKGLQSHNGVPAAQAWGLPPPKCDTTMFVSFIDGDFKAVKYYRNATTEAFDDIDDPRYPGECMYASSWVITEHVGMRSFPRMMYTNDFDDRRVLQERTIETTIVSTDLGYDPPHFSDFIDAPESCRVGRNRVFKRTEDTDVRDGDSIRSVVLIPQYSREAYYYAVGEGFTGGTSGSKGIFYDYLPDPNIGYGWRCFPRTGIDPPWPSGQGCDRGRCGGHCDFGGRGVHKERRIVCTDYLQTDCSDFADSGQWLSLCDIVDGFTANPPIRLPSITSYTTDGLFVARAVLMTPGYGGPLALPHISYNSFDSQWAAVSPDLQSGAVQSLVAEHSAIGDDAVVYMTDLDGHKAQYGYFPDTPVGFPCFVGVNKP